MPKEPIYITADENGFRPEVLDEHLANGFYRMQHLVFTTNYLQTHIPEFFLPVFWLRTRVADVAESKTAKSIRKACKSFIVTYKKAIITNEINELYLAYKSSVDFSASDTCSDYLHQAGTKNPFDSMMVEIRDCTRLIAVGYFDKGSNSIAGILNFYHPDYKKYSLGKYLILKKIDYALGHGIEFYYTGYMSTIYTKFDYKLYPDTNAIEVWLPVEKEWTSYNLFSKDVMDYYFYRNIADL